MADRFRIIGVGTQNTDLNDFAKDTQDGVNVNSEMWTGLLTLTPGMVVYCGPGGNAELGFGQLVCVRDLGQGRLRI